MDIVFFKYIQPKFFFHFSLFEWLHLKPLSPEHMYTLIKVMGVSACCIALGIFTRISLCVFFCTYGYTFLIEKAYYNNHYYLILLITFWLFFTECNNWGSFDLLYKDSFKKRMIPYWHIFIFRIQICIVYFFAGLAKISKDYLDGRQMDIWLVNEDLAPQFLKIFPLEFVMSVAIYFTLFVDLLLPFLLCYRRTRIFAFFLAIIFHIINRVAFDIGIFHYFMIAALIFFIDPDEPSKIWSSFKSKLKIGVHRSSESLETSSFPRSIFKEKLITVFLLIYLVFQALIPLRHLIIPGDVNWTREGHRFSWRLKANVTSGLLNTIVVDPETKTTEYVDPNEYLTPVQYVDMTHTPDMMLQYAHFLKKEYQKKGIKDPQVKMISLLSLNGRPFYPYIDIEADLSSKSTGFLTHADWILPAPRDL